MTDTPRTDAISGNYSPCGTYWIPDPSGPICQRERVIEIESDLAAMTAERDTLQRQLNNALEGYDQAASERDAMQMEYDECRAERDAYRRERDDAIAVAKQIIIEMKNGESIREGTWNRAKKLTEGK